MHRSRGVSWVNRGAPRTHRNAFSGSSAAPGRCKVEAAKMTASVGKTLASIHAILWTRKGTLVRTSACLTHQNNPCGSPIAQAARVPQRGCPLLNNYLGMADPEDNTRPTKRQRLNAEYSNAELDRDALRRSRGQCRLARGRRVGLEEGLALCVPDEWQHLPFRRLEHVPNRVRIDTTRVTNPPPRAPSP